MKPAESHQQFLARYSTAVRFLEEQEVKLPDVVLGYILMKKSKLDGFSECMLLMATKSCMKMREVVDALKRSSLKVRVARGGPRRSVSTTRSCLQTMARCRRPRRRSRRMSRIAMAMMRTSWKPSIVSFRKLRGGEKTDGGTPQGSGIQHGQGREPKPTVGVDRIGVLPRAQDVM